MLEERVTNVSSTYFPGHNMRTTRRIWRCDVRRSATCAFTGTGRHSAHVAPKQHCLTPPTTSSLSLGTTQKLRVKLQKLSTESTRSIEFHLVGVDASIANAIQPGRIGYSSPRRDTVCTLCKRAVEIERGCDGIRVRMGQYLRHHDVRRGLFALTWVDPLECGSGLANHY